MKQIIILVATIILGLAIGSFVIGFSNDAETLATNASGGITTLSETVQKGSGIKYDYNADGVE